MPTPETAYSHITEPTTLQKDSYNAVPLQLWAQTTRLPPLQIISHGTRIRRQTDKRTRLTSGAPSLWHSSLRSLCRAEPSRRNRAAPAPAGRSRRRCPVPLTSPAERSERRRSVLLPGTLRLPVPVLLPGTPPPAGAAADAAGGTAGAGGPAAGGAPPARPPREGSLAAAGRGGGGPAAGARSGGECQWGAAAAAAAVGGEGQGLSGAGRGGLGVIEPRRKARGSGGRAGKVERTAEAIGRNTALRWNYRWLPQRFAPHSPFRCEQWVVWHSGSVLPLIYTGARVLSGQLLQVWAWL